MRAMRILLALVFVFAVPGHAQSLKASQQAAAQVLGPQWKQVVVGSGMIFSGRVLRVEPKHEPQAIPTVEVMLRVEHAIAGVQANQVLTVREWAGAWAEHPMTVGQQVLLFLYPGSSLGLTSPVGGAIGQVAMQGDRVLLSHEATGSVSTLAVNALEPAIRRAWATGKGGRR